MGTTYKVTFRANARSGNTPNVKVYIDGIGVLLPGGPDGLSTAAVGAANSYWTVAFDFQAAAASQILAVVNDANGDQTLLVDDFKITPSSGKWSVGAWTGDADSGVDATFFYTHAYNFGSSAGAVINGITFTGVAGGGPAVAGQFSTAYLGILYTGDVNNLSGAGDGSTIMAMDFVYGGNVPPAFIKPSLCGIDSRNRIRGDDLRWPGKMPRWAAAGPPSAWGRLPDGQPGPILRQQRHPHFLSVPLMPAGRPRSSLPWSAERELPRVWF